MEVSILRQAERAHGTGTVLMITTTEEVIHGTDVGIAGVNEDVHSLGVSTSHMPASYPSILYSVGSF